MKNGALLFKEKEVELWQRIRINMSYRLTA